MSVTLYRHDFGVLPIETLLGQIAERLDHAFALLYTPRCCPLARFANGTLVDDGDHAIATGQIFEARIFAEAAEVRWLRDGSTGRGVALAETSIVAWGTPVPIECVATLRQRYLLWGEQANLTAGDGWSVLSERRIGALPVPLSGLKTGGRVQLVAREYLAERDHGNVVVIEERLLGLVPASTEAAR